MSKEIETSSAMKKDFSDEKNHLTRSKAIRAKCLDCCYDDKKQVRLCEIKTCPLWMYRMGNMNKSLDPQTAVKTKRKCGYCGESGHNSRRCPTKR